MSTLLTILTKFPGKVGGEYMESVCRQMCSKRSTMRTQNDCLASWNGAGSCCKKGVLAKRGWYLVADAGCDSKKPSLPVRKDFTPKLAG